MNAKQEWGHRMAKKAFRKLDTLVKARGHGAISKLERSLGYEEGWFKNHRRAKHIMSFPNVFAVLREIGERPDEFFAGLVDEEEEEKPSSEMVLLVRLARDRAAQISATNPAGSENDKALAALDELRYSDPLGALEQLSERIRTAKTHPEIAKSLGIAGSSYRILEKLEPALECIGMAQKLAGKDNPLLRGDLLQRMVPCYNRIDPLKAYRLAQEACLIYSREMNFAKIGETQIDLATTFQSMGDLEQAYRQLMGAYRYKNFLGLRHLAGMYQFLAWLSHSRKGDSLEAGRWLDMAEESAEELGNENLAAHIVWLRGRILRKAELLDSASRMLCRTSPFDALCCILNLCEILIEKGELSTLEDFVLLQAEELTTEPFVLRALQNILSSVKLGRDLNIPSLIKGARSWRARRIDSQLAHLES